MLAVGSFGFVTYGPSNTKSDNYNKNYKYIVYFDDRKDYTIACTLQHCLKNVIIHRCRCSHHYCYIILGVEGSFKVGNGQSPAGGLAVILQF